VKKHKTKRQAQNKLLKEITNVIAVLSDEDIDPIEILGATLVILMRKKNISMKGLVSQVKNLRHTAQRIDYLQDQDKHPLNA